MSNALIQIDRKDLSIRIDKDVENQKCFALLAASDIENVTSPEEQAKAVSAQNQLAELRKMVEASRKAEKAPFIVFGRTLDTTVTTFLEKVIAEEDRIGILNGNYQQLLIAREKALQAARQAELSENERLCQERLVKAANLDEHQAIKEEHAQVAAQMPSIAPRPIAKGQLVKTDIEFEVQDPRALYLSFPNLVNLEPKRREIKEALEEGINLPGVTWRKVVNSHTRGKAQAVLDV